MSSGLYSHTTRSTGTVLTAAIYNADHVNHITNANPDMIGGYSDNVGQMQLTTDPGDVGTETLATNMAGEVERLRYMIKALTGEAEWYVPPATDVDTLFGQRASVLLQSGTLSNVANLDLTFTAGYRSYELIITARPATDAVDPMIRVSTNGSTFISTASYSWCLHMCAEGGDVGITDELDNQMVLAVDVSNVSPDGYDGRVTFINPHSTTRTKLIRGDGAFINDDGNLVLSTAAGRYDSTTAILAARFQFTSGNIAEGQYAFIGYL